MAPLRPGLTRRGVLALAMGAAALRGARAEAQPLQTPRTIQGCVASMETLISPEAIDKIAELSEARQHEYRPGIGYLRQARWGEEWGGAVRGALEAECVAAGFEPGELAAYIISTIAWRRRGRPLDVATQLAPFREARRREKERRAQEDAKAKEVSKRTGVRVIGPCYLEILDQLYFARGDAKPGPGQEKLMDAFAQTLIGNPQMIHVEVQAHAARGESSPGELSRERAVAVVQELVRLGVPAERLTAHGLGTRFSYRARAFDTAPKKDARDADARAEFFILRRAEA